MLGSKFRSYLKDCISIGTSAIIRHPYTKVNQPDGALLCFIETKEAGEEAFDDFGIFHLTEFLNILEYAGESEISLNNGIITIKANNFTQKYETTNLSVMSSFDVNDKVLENIRSAEPVLEIDLSKDTFDQMKKVASILNLERLLVNAGKSVLYVANLDDSNQMRNETAFNTEMQTAEKSTFVFDMRNVSKIPSDDYIFRIVRNPKTSSPISYFQAKSKPITIICFVKEEIK